MSFNWYRLSQDTRPNGMMAIDMKIAKTDPRAWDALTPPLAEWILDWVSTSGFAKMTPVQAAVIPLFLEHKDVVVEAVTGSGKTIAFLIPVVSRILASEQTKRHHVASIIISPTRELATQIHSVLMSLLKFHAASAELLPYLTGDEKRPASVEPCVIPQLLVGGSTTVAKDLSFFLKHSPNILIATPGRLVELLSSPHVNCPQSSFEVLVMDEADRLLDLGFKPDLQKILGRLPKQRRTGLFSASVCEAVAEIIRVGLRNPVKVVVKVKSLKTGGVVQDRRTPASLQMTYLITPASHKLPALMQLLAKMEPRPMRTIVFLSTCAAVDYFSLFLPDLLPDGYSLITLHGKHQPKVRQRNFARFITSTSPSVLVTTDLAARGLDVEGVDLVVQVDPPSDPKNYLHRAGRAGRAGRRGLSVLFLQPGKEEDYLAFLEIRKTPVAPHSTPAISVSDAEALRLAEKLRLGVKEDRAHSEKAQRAFVSWVRSYSKHTASSIFSVSELDWEDLGLAWGLLRLPKMPELKHFRGDKKLGVEMDWATYAYKDKSRETARLEALEAEADPSVAAKAETEKSKRKRNGEAWSGKHEQEHDRTKRREKRQKKTDAKRQLTMTDEDKMKERELAGLLAEVRRHNQAKFAKEATGASVQ